MLGVSHRYHVERNLGRSTTSSDQAPTHVSTPGPARRTGVASEDTGASMGLGSSGPRPFKKSSHRAQGATTSSRPQLYVPDPIARTGEYSIFGLTRAGELATAR